jgi:hypothetical protein
VVEAAEHPRIQAMALVAAAQVAEMVLQMVLMQAA